MIMQQLKSVTQAKWLDSNPGSTIDYVSWAGYTSLHVLSWIKWGNIKRANVPVKRADKYEVLRTMPDTQQVHSCINYCGDDVNLVLSILLM